MTTHYLGTLASGQVIGRKSNRPDFTHACAEASWTKGMRLPAFGTSAAGALRNFGLYRKNPEVVAVRIVDATTYRKAMS